MHSEEQCTRGDCEAFILDKIAEGIHIQEANAYHHKSLSVEVVCCPANQYRCPVSWPETISKFCSYQCVEEKPKCFPIEEKDKYEEWGRVTPGPLGF